jgi:hypothetical protein
MPRRGNQARRAAEPSSEAATLGPPPRWPLPWLETQACPSPSGPELARSHGHACRERCRAARSRMWQPPESTASSTTGMPAPHKATTMPLRQLRPSLARRPRRPHQPAPTPLREGEKRPRYCRLPGFARWHHLAAGRRGRRRRETSLAILLIDGMNASKAMEMVAKLKSEFKKDATSNLWLPLKNGSLFK